MLYTLLFSDRLINPLYGGFLHTMHNKLKQKQNVACDSRVSNKMLPIKCHNAGTCVFTFVSQCVCLSVCVCVSVCVLLFMVVAITCCKVCRADSTQSLYAAHAVRSNCKNV